MKNLENVKFIEVYEYDTEHYIDIIETDEIYEAWLYRRDYGVKTLMTADFIVQISKEEFMHYVTANVLHYFPFFNEELSTLVEER